MCNGANELVLPLEEIDVNNSDLLPTLASEETLLDSTFKLRRKKIEKYHIAFQILLLKMDNNVFVTINHKTIYYDLSLIRENLAFDEISNRVTPSEATLLKMKLTIVAFSFFTLNSSLILCIQH